MRESRYAALSMIRRSAIWPLLVVVALFLVACTSSDSATPSPGADDALPSDPPVEAGDGTVRLAADADTRIYRIVTLGDSYTIGTGTEAPRRDSWPAQMYTALTERGEMRLKLVNLARRSSPSVEVIDSQLAYVASLEPDVVTLQVGVDDIVGRDTESYAGNIAHILDELRLLLPPERIFVITTPDHTLTEWGKAHGPSEVVEAINADLREVAGARGITVIDIGPVNERVTEDPSLLVQSNPSDPPRPYPTAKQYAGWAELIGAYVRAALEGIEP